MADSGQKQRLLDRLEQRYDSARQSADAAKPQKKPKAATTTMVRRALKDSGMDLEEISRARKMFK